MNPKIVSAIVLLACMYYACEAKPQMYEQPKMADSWFEKTQKLKKTDFEEMQDDGENSQSRRRLALSQVRRIPNYDELLQKLEAQRPKVHYNADGEQNGFASQGMAANIQTSSSSDSSQENDSNQESDPNPNRISKETY